MGPLVFGTGRDFVCCVMSVALGAPLFSVQYVQYLLHSFSEVVENRLLLCSAVAAVEEVHGNIIVNVL